MNLNPIAKAVAASLLVFASSIAAASPISPIEYLDADSGKSWLTLSETVGLSIQDFINGERGWNQSYRLAGNGEIGQLLHSFGVYSTPGSLTAGFGNFVGYVGGTTPNGFAGTWQSNGSQGAIGRSYGAYVSVGLIDGDAHMGLGECPQYFSCSTAAIDFVAQDWSDRAENAGLFLIRDDVTEVPEPGSLALLGLAGLAALRRRRVARPAN